jgi:ribosomal protein S18 acetylase RimI-like enzyme
VFDGIGMGLGYHQSPAYQPDLDLIAVDAAGMFVAFCLCELHQVANGLGEHTVGEIGVIGTSPTHQKHGLGRALLLAGMHLFTSVGFRTVSAWQWMTKEIAPTE